MTEQIREFFQAAIYAGLLLWRLRLLRARWQMPLMHGREYFLGKRVVEGFYDGAGARILAGYRRTLLLPWLLEAVALTTLIATRRLFENITWLLLGAMVAGLGLHALAMRRSWKQAEPYILPGGPPPKVALPLESRELKHYTHPSLEAALILVTVGCVGFLIWRDGFHSQLYPALLVCYLQVGLILIKRSLVDWRSPLPADQAESYHRLRQAQRIFFMRACDWLRGFGGVFLLMLVIGSLRGEDAVRWASATLGIGYLIAYAIGTMRDMQRVARLATEVRPVKLYRTKPDHSVQHVVVYRPELPAMFVRRARDWALNFGNPRALMYAGYVIAGVILGAVSARAGTAHPYNLALQTSAATRKLPPSLQGRWEGSLGGQMRIVFEFTEGPDGRWKGILRSPDQGNGAVPLDEVKLEGSKLHLAVASIHGTWDGTFDGRKLQGKWTQGQEIPLDLFRPGSPAPEPPAARKWGLPLTPCRVANDRVEGLCGSFEVFENRATKTGRKIKLAFLVIPATAERPDPDPVFLIAGGPGQGSIEAFAQSGYLKVFRDTRDVVMLDQRGTGGSNRLGCASTRSTSRVPTPEQLAPCREELEKIADLRQYTTSIAADDLDDVRAALGYQKINLLGGSYGTRDALEYMRRHGDRVRSAILKGVAPPGYKLPLPFARTVQDALEHLFVDCAADAKCRAAYPKLKQDFEALLDHLAKDPLHYRAEPPMSPQPMDWMVTRDGFLDMLRPMMYTPSVVALLPRLIHEASSGDLRPLGAISYQIVSQLEKGIARGMSLSVLCSEDVPFISDEEVARETRGTYMGDSNVKAFRQACAAWPNADVPRSYLDPVKSDLPVLLISGDEDPATPPASAELAARYLPNSRHVVIRGGTHGTTSECIDKISADFVARGSAKDLGTACVAGIKRPTFVVP